MQQFICLCKNSWLNPRPKLMQSRPRVSNKKNFLIFPLAVIVSTASFSQGCRSDISAMNPYNMVCQQFDSSCDMPAGWIEVNDCDISKIAESHKLPQNVLSARDFIKNIAGQNVLGGRINQPTGATEGTRIIPGGMNFYIKNEEE